MHKGKRFQLGLSAKKHGNRKMYKIWNQILVEKSVLMIYTVDTRDGNKTATET